MLTVTVDLVDLLNALLADEQSALCRFFDEGGPYLPRAHANLRTLLQQMSQCSHRHCGQLHEMIESLGGVPALPGMQAEEQYLAYLSIEYLIPKLIAAKQKTIRLCEQVLRASAQSAPRIVRVLQEQLREHQSQFQSLSEAAKSAT